jgi:NAD(P)H-hydrate epimerase
VSLAGSDPPRIAPEGIPAVTADQMREVDRAMVEDLGIELLQMMENAGRNLTDVALRMFAPTSVTVLAGPGGNGGGGLVAARHLHNRGVAVTVTLAREDALAPVTIHQLDILRRMAVPVSPDPPDAELVLDALIGYSLRGDPAGRAAQLIEWTNGQRAPVLSLDSPSGLDVTTGRAGSPCVRATATMTLALPKTGLLAAPREVGRL